MPSHHAQRQAFREQEALRQEAKAAAAAETANQLTPEDVARFTDDDWVQVDIPTPCPMASKSYDWCCTTSKPTTGMHCFLSANNIWLLPGVCFMV